MRTVFTFCLCVAFAVAAATSAFGQDWAGLMEFGRSDLIDKSPLSAEDKTFCRNLLDKMEEMELPGGFDSVYAMYFVWGAFLVECFGRLPDGLSPEELEDQQKNFESGRDFGNYVIGQMAIAREPLPDNRLLIVAPESSIPEAGCEVNIYLLNLRAIPPELRKQLARETISRVRLDGIKAVAKGTPEGGTYRWDFEPEGLGFVSNLFRSSDGHFINPKSGEYEFRVIYTTPLGEECEDVVKLTVF